MSTKPDRIAIEYNLYFATPSHFGTGMRVGLADRTVARDYEGHLYVPGSTFKGVVREYCEQLSRFYETSDTKDDSTRVPRTLKSPHDAREALRELARPLSMVTRIFGSQYHPGLLFFDDILQSQEAVALYSSDDEKDQNDDGRYKSIQTGISTQVRLDRPTRTAVKGALYTSEFGVKGMRFFGTITGWLECTRVLAEHGQYFQGEKHEGAGPSYSLLLLLAGLCMVERMGGNKSTGKGQCSCEITGVSINGEKYTKEQCREWLECLDALFEYGNVQGGRLL